MLTLEDPDGLPVILVGMPNAPAGRPWSASSVPGKMQIRGLHHVTFWTEPPDETDWVLEQHLGFKHLGFKQTDDQGGVRRYRTDAEFGHMVMVRDASGFWPSAGGVGTLHHVAFRARDSDHERSLLRAFQAAGR